MELQQYNINNNILKNTHNLIPILKYKHNNRMDIHFIINMNKNELASQHVSCTALIHIFMK